MFSFRFSDFVVHHPLPALSVYLLSARCSTVHNKAKQIKSLVLSVTVGFTLFCPAYLALSDGNMVGVQIDDWIVMFSRTQASIVLGEFAIAGVGTYEAIVTDLDSGKSYDAYLDGEKQNPPPASSGNGLAKFSLDLPLQGETYAVNVWDMSSEIVIETAEVSGVWDGGTHYINQNITVGLGETLTVKNGAVAKFAPGVQMTVEGTIIVDGTEGTVVFTSVYDDDYGVDLDGQGLAYEEQDPAPGDWDGIFLNGMEYPPLFDFEGIGQFDHYHIRYGGNIDGQADSNVCFFSSDSGYFYNSISEGSANYGVTVTDCSLTFRHSRIAENNSYGIHITGTANPDLGTNDNSDNWGYNSIRDNGGYQLYNTTSNTVSAVGNYWNPADNTYGPVDDSNPLSSDPTMVMLSNFTAAIRDGKVILIWRTEVEVHNVGFVIYRGDTKDGNYVKIAFVPGAEDSETSSDYRFTDEQVQPGHTYYYYLEDVDVAGERTKSEIIQVEVPAFSTQAELGILPEQNALLGNYPNPSNPGTWIPYDLAEAADVTIRIYDIRGHLIRTLHLGHQPAGSYLSKGKAVYWDGQDDTGERVGSGVYFYRLSAGNFSVVRKMVVLR